LSIYIIILIKEEKMAYFQNPFSTEFRGNWVLTDRQYSLTFVCPPNAGRSELLVSAWKEPTGSPEVFDLSGDDADDNSKSILTLRLSTNGSFQNYTNITVDLTSNTNAGLSPEPVASAMKPSEIVSIMNADPTFSTFFTAKLQKGNSGFNNRIVIIQKLETSRMKFIVLNSGAETVLGFNARAGIAQLPSYFTRCKIWGGDMTEFSDGNNSLILLDPSNSGGSSEVDDSIIENAVNARGESLGLNSSEIKADWELLAGRASGLFSFQKLTVDSNDRITEIIEYPAGAKVGDLGRKTQYQYTGNNKNASQITKIPYVIKSEDLVTP
jgi:hypothetical protein